MKTFKSRAAQGDVYIMLIDALPPGVERVAPEGQHVVVAHSETGHNHVMDAARVEMYRLPDEIYECFIVVKQATPLEHLRSFDTHEALMHQPGIYRVRRQREYVPEGWRRAAD
jgi:hypothetical protein